MPELPEIEVYCKHIRRSLKGKTINRIEIRKPNVSDLSERKVLERIRKKKGGIKAIVLNQKIIAGIGHACIPDIMFRAKVYLQGQSI